MRSKVSRKIKKPKIGNKYKDKILVIYLADKQSDVNLKPLLQKLAKLKNTTVSKLISKLIVKELKKRRLLKQNTGTKNE